MDKDVEYTQIMQGKERLGRNVNMIFDIHTPIVNLLVSCASISVKWLSLTQGPSLKFKFAGVIT